MSDFENVREFARHMLNGNRLTLRPLDMQVYRGSLVEAVLYRDGCWQVEMVTSPPNVEVPVHRHNRVVSCDVALTGSVHVEMGGHSIICRATEGLLASRLLSVPKGRWHGGRAGETGAVFLSFQKWDGAPGFISDDWELHDAQG